MTIAPRERGDCVEGALSQLADGMQDFEMEEEALMEAIKLYVKPKEMDCKLTAKDDGNC
jgi:hypothetical protein